MGAGICAPAKLQQGEENRGEKPPFAYQTAPTLPAKQIVQTTTTTPLNPNSNSTFISKKTPTTENGNDDTTNLKTSMVAFDTTAPKSENQTLQKGQVTTTTTTPHPPPITPPPSPSPSTATTTANATNDAITSSTIVAGENDTKKLTRTPTTLTTNDNNATRKKSPKTDNAIDNNNDKNESNNVRSPAESPGRWDEWDEVDDDLALQKVRDISCCWYNYKDRVSRGDGRVLGFIAQQVKEHLPEAISIQKSIITQTSKRG